MATPRAEMPAMRDYGVQESTWRPLPWSWAQERLVANRNYWVVTADAAGRPHAMPVWGVWDPDEDRFLFSCAPSSRKARNLAQNPRMVVAVDDTVECISAEGTGVALDDVDRREQWIERYLAKYRPISPDLDGEFVRSHLMVEFTPERVLGVIERDEEFSTRPTRWAFDAAG